jgi:cyclic pyranopterin phosphate synthase
MANSQGLVDRFGRVHNYLRLSVTDRCNFRCVYCMPAEGMDWMPRADILSFEEMSRLITIFANLGIERVRITGGEPTLRRDLVDLVALLSQLGLKEISMTTNGLKLPELAAPLAKAGLTRVNISLDSLQPERFSKLTRGAPLAKVLAGIQAAWDAGLSPVKINAVLLRGENDDEVEDLVRFFEKEPHRTHLRFIEYMPFESRWHKGVPAAELRQRIGAIRTMKSVKRDGKGGPAEEFELLESGLRVGFISPLSERFCGSCNRLRLMANGHLRTCLSDDGTPSLRDLIRGGSSDQELTSTIKTMVSGKRESHGCTMDGGTLFEGVMTRIGG